MSVEIESNQVPQIDEQVRRTAEAISIVVGGDFGMSVGVGEPGSGWHWDFVNNHVNMDPDDLLNESEDVVYGIATHEGSHRYASRAEHVQDLWREPGFSYGFNAVEDPRVNQAGMTQKPGSRPWIKAYVERDLGEDGGLNYQDIEANAKDKLGYVPKHMKWGCEVIRYWHGRELADERLEDKDRQAFLDSIPDEDVRASLAATLDDFEDFYQTIPDSRDEMEIQIKARGSSAIFKDKIWPNYKELVEQAFDEQSLVEMIKDMLQDDQQSQPGDANGAEIPFDSLPQEIQDEIKQKIDEQMQQQEQQKSEQGEQGEEAQGGGESGESADDQNSSGQSQGAGQQQPDSSQSSDASGSSEQGQQIPWDELSDAAKQAAQQAFDDLSEEGKQEYQQAGQESLEDTEDDANEQLRGKMNDPRDNETHKEQQEREAKEQQAEEQMQTAKKISDSMDDARRQALEQLPENPYHEFLQLPEVAGAIRQLDHEFRRIFEANEDPDVRFRGSGLRPNMRRVMQRAADPRHSQIFESRGRPTEKSHRFLWNVDLSGSMGDKIAEIFKALVIDIELSNKHGLETAVTGFPGRSGPGITQTYKDFTVRKLRTSDRENLGRLLQDGLYGGGSTPLLGATGESFEMLKQRMSMVPMNNNYFITLTDGDPTDSSIEQLAEKITNLRKDREVITAGFGIGPGTDYINDVYPALHDKVRQDIARRLGKNESEISNSFENAADFAIASMVILSYMVSQPELFYVKQ